MKVELRQPLQRRQPEQRARVLVLLDDPAEHELVDVGHLVEAGLDHLVGGGEGWNVPRDAHAELVRHDDDRLA